MSTRPTGNPVEPSVAGRLFHGVTGFFVVPALMAWDGIKIAAHYVWTAPKIVQVILAAIAVLCLAGGTFVVIKKMGGRDQEAINAEWKKFEVAARNADEKEMLGILDAILTKEPVNRDAQTRKAAIESGEADPADKPMLGLVVRIHLKNNRHPEAVREAKKMFALDPQNWMANCILGQDAIFRKDEPAIEKYLSAVSDPQMASPPDLGGLLYALELHKQAGRDADILRTFTVNKVIPTLKNANMTTIHPAGRIQVLACFIDTCLSVLDATVPSLVGYWSWSARLADSVLEDARESGNAMILNQLGTLQPPLGGVISRFQKLNLMEEGEAKRQMKEVEDRARKVWRAMREVDPKNPQGYVGEAYALLRAKDTNGAIRQIVDGQKACGEWNLPLLIAYTAWAKEAKQSEAALPNLLLLANKHPDNVALWQLVAETAEAAKRRDVAIDAVHQALKKSPNSPWLIWAEARMWLDADLPKKAHELLLQIPEKDRVRTPAMIRAFTRALAGAGDEKLIPDFARQAMTEADRASDPALALAPALGLLDCPPTMARAELADKIADQVHLRWQSSLDAVRARAQARVRAAEEDTPRWSEVRVRAATDALVLLKTKAPADQWAAAMLAWVRYKGGQSVDHAWNDLTPVLPFVNDPTLPAETLEVVGTLYYARGKYVEAIDVLSRAVASARQPAGPLVTLALTHYKNGDVRSANSTLRTARAQTMSERVREEYTQAAAIIPKE